MNLNQNSLNAPSDDYGGTTISALKKKVMDKAGSG